MQCREIPRTQRTPKWKPHATGTGEMLRKDDTALERTLASQGKTRTADVVSLPAGPQSRRAQLIVSLQVLTSKPVAASKLQMPRPRGG